MTGDGTPVITHGSGAAPRLQPDKPPDRRRLDLLALLLDRVLPWLLFAASLWLIGSIARGEGGGPQSWLRLLNDANATRPLAFLFGLAGVYYGLRQRSLRREAVARLERRVEQLEGALRNARAGTRAPEAGDPRP